VRFERDLGEGFERLFPETFSFHPERHDPAELYLQLDDLSRKPGLLSPRANRRDSELLTSRLVLGAPRYLERLIDRLEVEHSLSDAALCRVYEDVALLAQSLSRIVSEQDLSDRPGVRIAVFHLRKLLHRCLYQLMSRRVSPEYRDAYVAGAVDPVDPADDLSDSGFFYTLESGDQDCVNRTVVRLAERAFYRWLEDVCLDEDNRAFEGEDSPFGDRETEVLAAVACEPGRSLLRASDLIPFLRRSRNRDCLRVLRKLSVWFLHQYDVRHAAAVIRHAEDVARGRSRGARMLSRHGTRNYLLAMAGLAAPFVGAAGAYERAPRLFDAWCSAELVLVAAATLWFLVYRFCWRRDLSFFHASAPRIAAGIIVGYLPIFFIDEIWGFVARPFPALLLVSVLLGFMTLLYIYTEVERRLEDRDLAFARAGQIFLLGLVQALSAGLLITGLTGGYMASRNWSGADAALPVELLRDTLPTVVGQLPAVVGVAPLFTFPSALFTMAFFSFFIGTFLQLLWEDIPITEPL
jgi:hypothetical protein